MIALSVFVAITLIVEIMQFTGYYMFTYMMVYQCTYVLGDLNFMTITLTVMSVICAIAGVVSPLIVRLCRGRKRAYVAMMVLLAASYGVMMFTGDTLLGFLIPFVLACFFEGAYMGIILSAVCSFPPNTKLENLWAMKEAAQNMHF